MKVLKTLLLLAVAMMLSTSGFAVSACPQANATTCTASVNATITVQTAVWLQIVKATAGLDPSSGTMSFGNGNGLGVGTPATNVTVTTNPAAPAAGTAIQYATYGTPYDLFTQYSGFLGTQAGAVTVARTANTTVSASSLDLVEGATTATASNGGFTSVPSASTLSVATALADTGTGVTTHRQLAFKITHSNNATAAGTETTTVTYTLTVS